MGAERPTCRDGTKETQTHRHSDILQVTDSHGEMGSPSTEEERDRGGKGQRDWDRQRQIHIQSRD